MKKGGININNERLTKKQYAEKVLNELKKELLRNGGDTEKAVESLSLSQYDTLIDVYGDKIDNLIMTQDEKKILKQVTKSKRPCGLKYNKIYPQQKQNLYNIIAETLNENGYHIVKNKNFRDMEITAKDNTRYKIVLSQPRQKTE